MTMIIFLHSYDEYQDHYVCTFYKLPLGRVREGPQVPPEPSPAGWWGVGGAAAAPTPHHPEMLKPRGSSAPQQRQQDDQRQRRRQRPGEVEHQHAVPVEEAPVFRELPLESVDVPAVQAGVGPAQLLGLAALAGRLGRRCGRIAQVEDRSE